MDALETDQRQISQIIVRSKNLNRITPDETGELAQAIRLLLPDIDVVGEGYEPEKGTYAVTYFQIVQIFLTGSAAVVGTQLLQEITKAGIEWARARFKRKGVGSPIYIPIYGPDGRLLKSVLIKNATDEAEDHTEEDLSLLKSISKIISKKSSD